MIFFFLSSVLTTWVNYSDDSFWEIISQTKEKPLFALCYSPYCGFCYGLPEAFAEYNAGLGNRSDIYIMTINCVENNRGCWHFRITGTPTITLAIGNDQRYWQRTRKKGVQNWHKFINENVGPNLRLVNSSEEIIKARNEPLDGGSTFVLETNSENDEFISSLRNLSKFYRIYNDTFVYHIDKNIPKRKLKVYRSPNCGIEFNGDLNDLEQFVINNRFGMYHSYNYDEFIQESLKNPMILYLVEEEITPIQKKSLGKLAGEKCDGISYGWMAIHKDMRMLRKAKLSASDLPALVGVNNQKEAISTWLGKIALARDNLVPGIINPTVQKIIEDEFNIEEGITVPKIVVVFLGFGTGVFILTKIIIPYLNTRSEVRKHDL